MRTRILVAFATIYVVWGSTFLAIAYAVTSIPPLLMMGVRSLLAGGILYLWARLDGVAAPARTSWRPAAVAGAFLFLGGHGLLAWAEQRVPSGLAALVIATGTLWMIGVEWVRRGGHRPSRAVLAGAGVGLGGVAILVGSGGGIVPVAGAGALMLSSLLWAVGTLYARDCALPRSPRMATAMPLLAGGAMLVTASVATGEAAGFDPLAVDARAVLSLLYLVVFGSVAALTAYVWLLRVTSAVRVSTHNYVNPAVAVFLGWAVAGETVTSRVLLAAAIIIASIV
ncbi:MAG: EamA family transporter, partial [Longimicrobiales bacterium]